jgi:hypothetical protein
MPKIDFKRELKHLYRPSAKEFVVVDVPPEQFLMIDGHGDPNTAQEYQDAVEALYAVSYKVKFMSKKELGKDYVVPPLEGLWWAMQPEWITQEMIKEAVKQVEKKGLPALSKLHLETYHEGLSVQILHIGSYDDEAPTIARMHAFIDEHGYEPAGKHHEIYLSDVRKVAPGKLKTVLRQPVRKI